MSKDLYVIAEQRDGNIAKVTLELLGEATKLAADLGEKVIGVLMGDQIKDKAQELVEAGADEVIVIEDPMLAEYVTEPYTKALTAMIKEYDRKRPRTKSSSKSTYRSDSRLYTS